MGPPHVLAVTAAVEKQFVDSEEERVISLYTSKSLRSVGIDGRDGASWIDLQAWTASS